MVATANKSSSHRGLGRQNIILANGRTGGVELNFTKPLKGLTRAHRVVELHLIYTARGTLVSAYAGPGASEGMSINFRFEKSCHRLTFIDRPTVARADGAGAGLFYICASLRTGSLLWHSTPRPPVKHLQPCLPDRQARGCFFYSPPLQTQGSIGAACASTTTMGTRGSS